MTIPGSHEVTIRPARAEDKVAHFEEVSFKLGRWVDVGYWQRVL